MNPVLEPTTALEATPTWTPLSLTPITSAEQYVACAEHLKTIKAFQKRVTEFFKPHKRRLDEAKAALLADERNVLAPADADEQACKAALRVYDEAQELARQQEEQRLRDEARRQEEDRRLDEAAALEREGYTEEAVALVEEPVNAPAVMLAKTTPKVSGISFRENWSARVVSLPKLIAYVAAHPQHANLLMPNQAALNSLARSLKNGMLIDGVEAVRTKTTAAGTR
jgi:hypothetical protein